MPEPSPQRKFLELLQRDQRYKIEAYQFIRDALSFAQEELGMGAESESGRAESHLTGQELCEGIRVYALQQFGMMAKVVLNSWGLTCTGDFGNVVYNLIDIELMKKSESDRLEDFQDVFDFDQALVKDYRITAPE